MPTYDYFCPKCETTIEIQHSIKDESKQKCSKCKSILEREISLGSYVIHGGLKGTREDYKESEHKKKVKDYDRAVKKRKKMFGHSEVGDPSGTNAERHKFRSNHVMKRGRTLGGQQLEVDKTEMIKALAKDPLSVKAAEDALKKARHKK